MISATQKERCAEIRRLFDELLADMSLTDEAAFNLSAAKINDKYVAIRVYRPDKDYARGDMVIDPADGVPYWAMHSHGPSTGQVWQPSMSPTMWTHCHGTSPETARPFIAEGHNPYMAGHYCTEGEITARCNRDNVVHAPSVLPDAWEVIV